MEETRTWLGVPWRHQGRRRSGIDCAGLPAVVAASLGLSDYDHVNYPRRPDGTFLRFFERGGCVRISPRDADEGDVLIFSNSGTVTHCGIRSTHHGQPAVIHAYARRRMVVEETLEAAASVVGRPTHAYRMPGVAP